MCVIRLVPSADLRANVISHFFAVLKFTVHIRPHVEVNGERRLQYKIRSALALEEAMCDHGSPIRNRISAISFAGLPQKT